MITDGAASIEVHGDAFGKLVKAFGVSATIVDTYAVTPQSPSEQPRAYVVEVDKLPF